jgi:hypothetical protein
MAEVGPAAALLAGELARAVGELGVVCLSCPVADAVRFQPAPGPLERRLQLASPLLCLVRPPFSVLPLAREELMLVVHGAGGLVQQDVVRCALAGVPEVWLLHPAEAWLEALQRPVSGSYRRRSLVLPGESVALVALPRVRLTPLPRLARPRR